jgi:hypothetical protein
MTRFWISILIFIRCSWLRHCATNRKVAGSIPDGVMEFFFDILPPTQWPWGCLGLLTEMSTRNISWGVKAVGA